MASFAKGFGIGLVINGVVGFAKAEINSKWKDLNFEMVTYEDFNFYEESESV